MLKFLKNLFTSESEPERIPIPSPLVTAICISMKNEPTQWKLISDGAMHPRFGLTIKFDREITWNGDCDYETLVAFTTPQLPIESHEHEILYNAYKTYLLDREENAQKRIKAEEATRVARLFLDAHNPQPPQSETEAKRIQSYYFKNDVSGA